MARPYREILTNQYNILSAVRGLHFLMALVVFLSLLNEVQYICDKAIGEYPNSYNASLEVMTTLEKAFNGSVALIEKSYNASQEQE